MKNFLAFFIISLAAALPLQSQEAAPAWENEIIIRLEPGMKCPDFLRLLESRAADFPTFEYRKILSPTLNISLIEISGSTRTEAAVDFLRQQDGVLFAGPNTPVQFREKTPNDPLYTSQWDMMKIGLEKVWEVSTGGVTPNGDTIVVAVLDRGFDITHEEFQGNIWVNREEIPGDQEDNDSNTYRDDLYGWNFLDDAPFFNKEDHGTWVTGIIGAKGDNGIGLAGVNWNVKIMFLAVQLQDQVIEAFEYALYQRALYNSTQGQRGAFVVATNGSFGIDKGTCDNYPAWAAMYDAMGEVGILSVAATANENWDVDEVGDMPTNCTSEYLITVTNTNTNDEKVAGAAFGKTTIDLGAPGSGTVTTNTQNEFRENFSGTSSACPHVAGSVALLYSLPCTDIADLAIANPSEAALLIREAVLENTYPVSDLRETTVTGGRLDVYESMKFLHAHCIATTEERNSDDVKEIYFGEKGFIVISPNPTSHLLNIRYSNMDFASMKIRVFNALGQEVRYELDAVVAPFTPQEVVLDVSNWPTGTYFVNLVDNSQKIAAKFVKL